jgi:hypothetical protein
MSKRATLPSRRRKTCRITLTEQAQAPLPDAIATLL